MKNDCPKDKQTGKFIHDENRQFIANPPHSKVCCACKKDLPRTDFYPIRKIYVTSKCKACTLIYEKMRYDTVLSDSAPYKARVKEAGRVWTLENRDHHRKTSKRAHRAHRDACIAHYGPGCKCCGDTTYEFLAIDHIDGSGAEHRRQKGTTQICRWLVKNGFPPGYRVLCHNCNCAIGFYGYCPHQLPADDGTGNLEAFHAKFWRRTVFSTS